MEHIGLQDYSLLMDNERNTHIVVSVGIFEKFEFEDMKKYMSEKNEHIDRAQTKLVKWLGLYWFKKLTKQEWQEFVPKVITEVKGIHTQEALKDFAIKQQAVYDLQDAPQYKMFLIPDYQPGKSVVVFKIHHSMSDGLGIATLY